MDLNLGRGAFYDNGFSFYDDRELTMIYLPDPFLFYFFWSFDVQRSLLRCMLRRYMFFFSFIILLVVITAVLHTYLLDTCS